MTEKCPRCWIGDLHNIDSTYTRLMEDGQLFAMPHAPAWRCDICGFQAWDENFIGMMEASFGDGSTSPIDETEAYPYPHLDD